jgi:hypothetical protein
MLIAKHEYGTEVELTCKAGVLGKVQKNRLLVRPDGEVEAWDKDCEYWWPATLSRETIRRAHNWADYGK